MPSSASPSLSGNDLLLWSALPDLTLNIAQTAALCGVSVRQLGYWTKQGYVSATGRGSRRLYGPESLRRILAIRQAMQEGLSLRQALRALDTSEATPSTAFASTLPHTETGSEVESMSADIETVATELLALFGHNRHTRDSAWGLAAKIGRSAGDVRHVAERLSARGALSKTQVGSEAIYFLEGKSS